MRSACVKRRGLVQLFAALKVCCIIACGDLALSSGKALAEADGIGGPYPVGMKQMEYVDPADGRHLAFTLFYPAAPADNSAAPYHMPFFTNLHLHMDAPVVADTLKRPLVMFSHGAGSNGLYYAWFGEYLASRGYLVAMLYHYRANTYDSTVMYTRSKLWQRPRDVSLDITNLLHDKVWGPHIDPNRIGVAGHSQGGFTSLWIGGAKVNPDLYLAYQTHWRNNPTVPAYLRKELPLDASPARDVRDSRIKAGDGARRHHRIRNGRSRATATGDPDLYHRRRPRYPDAAQGKRGVCRKIYSACSTRRTVRSGRPRDLRQRMRCVGTG
jgi:predicted dienelactone hydrolase